MAEVCRMAEICYEFQLKRFVKWLKVYVIFNGIGSSNG